MDEPTATVLKGPWPEIKSAHDAACYGRNPTTDEMCRFYSDHRGFHEDTNGGRWLDDGDPAKPDWLPAQDARD